MRRKAIHAIGVFVAATLVLGIAARAEAARVPDLGRDAAIIVDGVSGRVLYERNAHEIRYPASLTKMMTLYLLFESFESGTLHFDSQLPTSSFAASQTPTKLNLARNETIDAKTAMEAIIVRSANDVAVVVAEAIGGTESGFARLMTRKAGELGMLNTHFANASGLPDAQQISTAGDMALLGRRIAYDFPEYYKFLALTEFRFKGRRYTGHNNLLGAFDGADGIKTGYTRASGFNLVTSAVRGNKHLVGVVMGGRTAASRDAEMMRILSTAFEEVEKYPLLVAYANVPWKNGDGPKIVPSWNAPVPPPVLLAAFGEEGQSSSSPNAIAVAALPSKSAIVPQEKPTPVLANAAVPFADGDLIASLIDSLSSFGEANASASQSSGQITETLPTHNPNAMGTSLTADLAQGDTASRSSGRSWSVQIGAFADETAANMQLEIYAEHSADVLGQAERLIVPYAGEGGSIYYRARFGPFEESEARAVCQRMITRGETCFASQHGPDT
jgi:D-alanyl-D-alanine carboxypeptidase